MTFAGRFSKVSRKENGVFFAQHRDTHADSVLPPAELDYCVFKPGKGAAMYFKMRLRLNVDWRHWLIVRS